MPETVKAPDAATDAEAVQKFAETVERFRRHGGALHPSPLFGTMTREEHARLQAIHAAHHLGFLIPKTGS
jgi:hypothetical protein